MQWPVAVTPQMLALAASTLPGLDLLGNGQADLSVLMRLMDEGVAGLPVRYPYPDTDRHDSHRHQGGIPVPAEITLRLAQHITADVWVMFGKGHEIWLTCLASRCGADRRMKGNFDLVAAHDKPVDKADDNGETHSRLRQLYRSRGWLQWYQGATLQDRLSLVSSQGKVPAGRPVTFSHPAHIIFIHAPIGSGICPAACSAVIISVGKVTSVTCAPVSSTSYHSPANDI